MKIGLFISVACHSDGVLARRYASERLSRHYDADFSERIRRYSIAGSPAECRARLAEYVSAGAEQVFLSSACPDEYLTTNERLLAEEVLPELR
jgi:alkanesulfonate monooxygenase SsuD/methylene tetrahydromethanopterin reductase-like flavin-dependent oxidoreductase (luciferase family)